MKFKQVTIKHVAQEAGVSVATVSRALNGLGGVGENTRKHVLGICEKLSYVPNNLARGLVTQQTRTIGIVVPDITSPFYSQLMVAAASEAKRCGYEVLLCNSFRNYETESNFFKLLIGHQVEGILFFPVGLQSAKNLYQYMRYVSIVSLNEMPEESPIPYICTDELNGGRIATEYLIESGCRNLLFVGMKDGRLSHKYRTKSFELVVEEAGICGEVFQSEYSYKSSFERGYGQFKEFLNRSVQLPDGIVAASDATANGIIKACIEHNIRIPDQISLIGFDHINVDFPVVELATVATSRNLHVRKAIDLLLEINSDKVISPNHMKIKLKPKLVKGQSCLQKERRGEDGT